MPTIISSSSFSVTFDLTTSPGTLVLVDTFNYGSAGIPLAGTSVLDCFTITAPDGNVFYSNSNFANPGADIVVSSGTTNVIPISLPTLPSGAPVPGVYTIVMTTRINDGDNAVYFVTTTNTINFTFVAPTISITQTVDCIGANFVSSDTTDYVVNGIAPVVQRTHDVYVPGNPLPVTGVSPIITLTSGQFYNGLQQTVLTSVCTWTFPDGSFVTATLTGSKSIAVDCTYFCAIYCCLRSINSNIKKYKGVNDMLASEYEATFAKVMGLVELATLAYSCGKSNDVAGYVSQIQALADCTSDCSCQDGAPSPVYGLGGGGTGVNVVVSSCSPSITTSSVTVGNTTTWTVCLDQSLVTKINGLSNTVVQAGTGVSVSSTSTVIGGIPTTTYTVNSTAVASNFCAFKVNIAYSAPSAVTLAIQNAQASGNLLQAPTSATSLNYPSILWQQQSNAFKVGGFLVTSTILPAYKVSAILVVNSIGVKNYQLALNVSSTVSTTNGEIYFNLYEALGAITPSNGKLITNAVNCTVHFIITTN
jgi:hypothetical protein